MERKENTIAETEWKTFMGEDWAWMLLVCFYHPTFKFIVLYSHKFIFFFFFSPLHKHLMHPSTPWQPPSSSSTRQIPCSPLLPPVLWQAATCSCKVIVQIHSNRIKKWFVSCGGVGYLKHWKWESLNNITEERYWPKVRLVVISLKGPVPILLWDKILNW